MNIDFVRNLIKGRIVEVIFEQMLRDEGRYTVIPFGYEHTVPTLSQYRNEISEAQKVIDNIADAPDFALISEDKTKLYLVEVKYQRDFDIEKIRVYCDKLKQRWESPWIFVATPDRFYCAPCTSVLTNGSLSELSESWVTKERQAAYVQLLRDFLK